MCSTSLRSCRHHTLLISKPVPDPMSPSKSKHFISSKEFEYVSCAMFHRTSFNISCTLQIEVTCRANASVQARKVQNTMESDFYQTSSFWQQGQNSKAKTWGWIPHLRNIASCLRSFLTLHWKEMSKVRKWRTTNVSSVLLNIYTMGSLLECELGS